MGTYPNWQEEIGSNNIEYNLTHSQLPTPKGMGLLNPKVKNRCSAYRSAFAILITLIPLYGFLGDVL